MTQKQRRWFAAPMLNRDGSPDRLKRWNVLEHSEARGKTVIATQIRSEDKAHLIAAAPELLKFAERVNDFYTVKGGDTWYAEKYYGKSTNAPVCEEIELFCKLVKEVIAEAEGEL